MSRYDVLEPSVRERIRYVLTDDRLEEWEVLRESLQDAALLRAPKDVFTQNMRAVYLQLLTGAMMKALGGLQALMEDPVGVIRLGNLVRDAEAEHGIPEVIFTVYNKAYGSTPFNVAVPIAAEFSRCVTGNALSQRAIASLAAHFESVWMGFTRELRSVLGRGSSSG